MSVAERLDGAIPAMETRYGRAARAGMTDRLEQATKSGRHHALFAQACEAGRLVAGGELDEVTTRTAFVGIGLHTLDLPRSDVERTVERAMAKGATQPKRAPHGTTGALFDRSDAVAAVIDWWEQVSSDPALRTRSGTTTLRILAGFAILAMSAGKLRVSDSYRQLAEVAGVSIGTISKHRVAFAPYVRPVDVPRRTEAKATVWQLVRRPGHLETTRRSRVAKPPALFPNGHGLDHPGHNAWHRRSGWWALWCALDAEGSTVDELAAHAGRAPRTVRRILATFAADGLAETSEGRWRRCDAPAEPVVDVDHAAARKDRHVADRAVWRQRRAAYAAERDAERELPPAERAALRRQRRAVWMLRRARRYEAGRAGRNFELDLGAEATA